MTLRGIFSFQNLDNTNDLNSLNAKIVDRGIFDNGLLLPSATSLEVSITPFVAVGYDGMVVQSDAIETVTIPANAVSYLICFSKWLYGSAPQLSIQVVTEVEWATSINRNYFITFAKLTVPLGATAILESYIDYSNADYADKAGKNTWRPRVSNYALLPTTGNRHGDTRLADKRVYYWNASTASWDPVISGELQNLIISNWPSIRSTGSTVTMHDLVYNPTTKRYVAVGEVEGGIAAIYTSDDFGVTWVKQVAGVDPFIEELYSIDIIEAFGNYLYVAAGKLTGSAVGIMAISVDGETWILYSTASGILRKVKSFGDDKMAVVGDGGAIYYTTNGLSWSNYTDTAPGNDDNKDIAHDGGSNWVITCTNGIIRQNATITNKNGWVTRESSGSSTVWSVDHGNGVFAAAMGPQVYVSADGITWTAYVVIPTGYAATKIRYITEYARFLLFCYQASMGIIYMISSNGAVYEDLTGSINSTNSIGGITMDDRHTLGIIDAAGQVHFSLRI